MPDFENLAMNYPAYGPSSLREHVYALGQCSNQNKHNIDRSEDDLKMCRNRHTFVWP